MVFKKFTIEEKQAFAASYNGGTTLKDLAAGAGVSIPTMAKYVRAGGGSVRPPGNPKNPKKGESVPVVEVAPVVAVPEVEPVRKIVSF
jgi:hypothetical protein